MFGWGTQFADHLQDCNDTTQPCFQKYVSLLLPCSTYNTNHNDSFNMQKQKLKRNMKYSPIQRNTQKNIFKVHIETMRLYSKNNQTKALDDQYPVYSNSAFNVDLMNSQRSPCVSPLQTPYHNIKETTFH